MSTLPLYWKLASSSAQDRLSATVDLVSSLEQFQLDHDPDPFLNGAPPETSADDAPASFVESLTSEDVRYALKRLTRGLASPKDSSRLGFAVALTELLSRMSVINAGHVIGLVMEASHVPSNVKGQQLRDLLFARLFGFNCLVQSGLLFKSGSLPNSTVSYSSIKDFRVTVNEYIALGERKRWLRETTWWSLLAALESLHKSDVPWKSDAENYALNTLFKPDTEWSPERLAAAVKMQRWFPAADWPNLLSPAFSGGQILASGSLKKVATILRETDWDADDEDEGFKTSKTRSWKPELHFAWDALIGQCLGESSTSSNVEVRICSIHEFFRIVVDESLFQTTSTPERKYWGFSALRKILAQVEVVDIPQLFTQNFTRAWMNNLSGRDKVLSKIAKQVVDDVKAAVEKKSESGFKIVMTLLGNTGGKFDAISKTKILQTLLSSMDAAGVKSYVDYLIDSAYSQDLTAEGEDAVNAKRRWVMEQLSSVVRNHDVPRDDVWIEPAMQFLTVHGLFQIKKKHKESSVVLLHRSPPSAFSDTLHTACRQHLYSCQTFLAKPPPVRNALTPRLANGITSDTTKTSWIARALEIVHVLEQDERHVSLLREETTEDGSLRKSVRKVLKQVAKNDEDAKLVSGLQLLLQVLLLRSYDEAFDSQESLRDVLSAVSRLLGIDISSSKKSKAPSEVPSESDEPIDVIADLLIGELESESAHRRDLANLVFGQTCHVFKDSTMDLLLDQVATRDPLADNDTMDEDEVEDDLEGNDTDSETVNASASSDDSSEDGEDSDDEEEGDVDVDPELRKRIAEALQIEDAQLNGDGAGDESDDGESSEEELMDDDQMMAIDDKLAEIFRSARNTGKKEREGAQRQATIFKTRIIDFIEAFVKANLTKNMVLKTIMPLINLAALSSKEEDDLSQKAAKVIKAVFGGRLDEPIHQLDTTLATTTLKNVHDASKNVHNVNMNNSFNPCCRFLIRNLAQSGTTHPVEELYRSAFDEYFTQKQSKFPLAILKDFIEGSPARAWALRERVLELCRPGVSTNTYHQLQAIQLLKDLVRCASNANSGVAEDVPSFIPSIATAFRDVVFAEAEKESAKMSAANLRELTQAMIAIARGTGPRSETSYEAWDSDGKLSKAVIKLKESKPSAPLHQALGNLVKLVGIPEDRKKSKKRKKTEAAPVTATPDGEAEGPSIPKKKKKREKEKVDQE